MFPTVEPGTISGEKSNPERFDYEHQNFLTGVRVEPLPEDPLVVPGVFHTVAAALARQKSLRLLVNPSHAMSSKRPSRHTEATATTTPRKIANMRREVQLPEIAEDSLVWSDPSTSCLSVGLHPNEATHRAVTCKGCINFFEKKLKSNINNYNPNLTRSRRHLCERPFHCRDGAMPYKLHTQERFKQLFAVSGTTSVPRTTGLMVSPPPPMRWPKSQHGPKPLFAENGSLSEDTVKRLTASLDGRNELEDNEIYLLHSLLGVYSRSEDVVKLLLDGSYLNLKEKQVLLPAEQRMLGQLSAVAFRGSKGKHIIECATFHRCMPVRLACLPTWHHHGKNSKSKRTANSRLESGMRWMSYLPGLTGDFNEQLIT